MATIKSFTSLEQSRKLAEILPIESADMNWNELPSIGLFVRAFPYKHDNGATEGIFPCWSLAALLEQLKAEIQLENKQILFLHINKYDDINYDIRYTNSWTGEVLIAEADNLIDACVAMIEKLNELNLL